MNKVMKLSATVILFILSLRLSAGWATEGAALLETNFPNSHPQTSDLMKDTLKIIIGQKNFTAVLESNAAGNEFKKMLPLTINMNDLNSNEKFFDLPRNLPTNLANPGTIHSGDLMLWGSNTLVLFYKTFNTSYSYTRLGKIENPSGLAQSLGSGNVTITFDLLGN